MTGNHSLPAEAGVESPGADARAKRMAAYAANRQGALSAADPSTHPPGPPKPPATPPTADVSQSLKSSSLSPAEAASAAADTSPSASKSSMQQLTARSEPHQLPSGAVQPSAAQKQGQASLAHHASKQQPAAFAQVAYKSSFTSPQAYSCTSQAITATPQAPSQTPYRPPFRSPALLTATARSVGFPQPASLSGARSPEYVQRQNASTWQKSAAGFLLISRGSAPLTQFRSPHSLQQRDSSTWQNPTKAVLPDGRATAPFTETRSQPHVQQQSAASWQKPAAEVVPGGRALDPVQAIKQQMRCNGVTITERVSTQAGCQNAWFDKMLDSSQGLRLHLVGTPDGLMHRSSAILVIKIRWPDKQTSKIQHSLSTEEELQLQGFMLICPGATHVEFVQSWQTCDGSYKYDMRQLLVRKQPETMAVLAQRRLQIIQAMKVFGGLLNNLLQSEEVQDNFVRSNND